MAAMAALVAAATAAAVQIAGSVVSSVVVQQGMEYVANGVTIIRDVALLAGLDHQKANGATLSHVSVSTACRYITTE